MATVSPVPEGYHTVTPYLIVAGAAEAIEFYKRAFGATELMRLTQPDGKIGHAELQIGDSRVMLADEFPEMGAKGPISFGGTPITLHLYVPNVDETYAQAVAAGATATRPVRDQFYGDRSGGLQDPFGHSWYLATHVEDVSEAELHRRFQAMMNPGQA